MGLAIGSSLLLVWMTIKKKELPSLIYTYIKQREKTMKERPSMYFLHTKASKTRWKGFEIIFNAVAALFLHHNSIKLNNWKDTKKLGLFVFCWNSDFHIFQGCSQAIVCRFTCRGGSTFSCTSLFENTGGNHKMDEQGHGKHHISSFHLLQLSLHSSLHF